MFLDPDKLLEAAPAEILYAAARGRIGLDYRFLDSLLARRDESLRAALAFAERDHASDRIDLTPDLIALFRHWKAPEGIPFLLDSIREDPEDVPDEVIEALVEMGQPALEPLLALYEELDESGNGEAAFVLASLGIADERILEILLERLEFDVPDTLLLLTVYGDPAARPAIEAVAVGVAPADTQLRKEIDDALAALSAPQPNRQVDPFDIRALYPEETDLPVELLDEDERAGLLDHPVASVRVAAASSFFHRKLSAEERKKLLHLARRDESAAVRARAWEALTESTEETEVVEAMLTAMRNPDLLVEERGGLLVGLAPEADRNEVRKAITDLYHVPEGRAKALEAMWRSLHPSFRDYFAKHLEDPDLETRRSAVWGVGHYGIKSELDRLRKLFEDEELRSDALFAYTLALPAEISRSRVKGLLARIEKDARGLSEMEEELVKIALDERLSMAGKEPVFQQQED